MPSPVDQRPIRATGISLRPRAHPAYSTLQFIPLGMIDPVYEAVVQATEESVMNALVEAGP
jgi:L-aminopeptidase/D-esterase-like protein